MSQAGKILQLYVEVRSVPEEEAHRVGNMEIINPAVFQGADVVPQHRCSSSPSTPQTVQREFSSSHSVAPSRSPSRHSVSFQVHPTGDLSGPSPFHRQSLQYDNVDQLHSPVQPGTCSATSLLRAHSSEFDCCLMRSPQSPASTGRATSPCTPNWGCRSSEVPEVDDGKKSIVTFSYIEKASIKSVRSPHSSFCQSGPDTSTNPFTRSLEERSVPMHFQKRLSDPIWPDGRESFCTSSQKPPSLPSGDQKVPSPNLRCATLDSIARAATHRALEEFGSQELRRKVANAPDSIRYNQQSQGQSWCGSPVPVRVASMFPSASLTDPEMCRSSCSLPRSPASDHLSVHARPEIISVSPASTDRSQGSSTHCQCIGSDIPRTVSKPTQILQDKSSTHDPSNSPHSVHKVNFNLASSPIRQVDGMNQLSGKKNISPANSPEMARKLAEEATKLSTIFMEARRSSSPALLVDVDSSAKVSKLWETQHHNRSESQCSPVQTPISMNIPLHDYSQTGSESPMTGHTSRSEFLHLQARDVESPALLRREERDGSTAQPQALHDVGSPALPSRLHRTSLHSKDVNQSPIRDPRKQKAELLHGHSPTLHRYQPPQYMGDCRSPDLERRPNPRHEQMVRDSPDTARKISFRQYGGVCSAEASVSSKQHCVETFPVNNGPKADHYGDQHTSPSQLSKRSKLTEHQRREIEFSDFMEVTCQKGSMATDRGQNGCSFQDKSHSDRHQSGRPGSSHSSSGITGSIGESGQQNGSCISPESSQSSQKSSDTGRGVSAIQPDGSSSPVGPSPHSQKIARAKWEFLFGTPSEGSAPPVRKDVPDTSTAPPSGDSSESPTPTPPQTLPLKPAAVQRARGEACQCVTSHRVQHVEVELVTPPAAVVGTSPKTGIIRRTLKYSETDLDAVPLRCYRETDIDEVLAEQEEADSAFGSSPLGGAPYARTDGEEEEEEEELEEEEEVVSWASVRMQGDKKRQNATQEEDEVFSPLLKRPIVHELEDNGPLKSPIAVTSPRQISEDGLDSFSRHFEGIMESHRAKGTSYSSLDSVDLLTSSQAMFTFDLPTLTPEIQSQICKSARHITELGFAPLAQSEQPSRSDSTPVSSESETTPVPGDEPSCGPQSGPSDAASKQNFCENIQPSLKEGPRWLPPDLHLESDLRERLGLGSTDALTNGSKADLEAARRLAKRLYNLDGFKKSDVARHLSKNNEFSQMVAEEYLRYFNFSGLTVDQALRTFLKEFALMGETQERERVLSHFSRRYLQCNPKIALSEDSVHTLTCALMLLNTDLHGHNIGKRMSCLQFIGNLEGLNDGQDFSKDLLKSLYSSIKNEKLQWTIDEEELRKSFSELADGRTDSASHTMKRISSGGNPFTGVTQHPGALVYKNGFLVRKVHADSDGKKTPRGKRGWKAFYAILKGLILYLQKGEYRPEKQLSDEDLKNAVSIHHSLAMRAADYSKRPNVFYLRTADWRVFLFQAPNAEQMQSWITRINTVAAMFSAPPFPAAIGSQKKFSRPLLPGSNTKLSQEEQVQSHEARFRTISSELNELRSCPPDRKVKGRELEEYRQREEYLDFEKTRYGTYAMLLRAKIQSGEEDLSMFESHLYDDSGLQRAHSSPTLQQEPCQGGQDSKVRQVNSTRAGSGKSSKRGESQRQSYRQAVKQ